MTLVPECARSSCSAPPPAVTTGTTPTSMRSSCGRAHARDSTGGCVSVNSDPPCTPVVRRLAWMRPARGFGRRFDALAPVPGSAPQCAAAAAVWTGEYLGTSIAGASLPHLRERRRPRERASAPAARRGHDQTAPAGAGCAGGEGPRRRGARHRRRAGPRRARGARASVLWLRGSTLRCQVRGGNAPRVRGSPRLRTPDGRDRVGARIGTLRPAGAPE